MLTITPSIIRCNICLFWRHLRVKYGTHCWVHTHTPIEWWLLLLCNCIHNFTDTHTSECLCLVVEQHRPCECVFRACLLSVPVSRPQYPKITAANIPSLPPYCTLFGAYRLCATYATKYCVGVCCCMWEIQDNCTIASTHCTEHLLYTPTIKGTFHRFPH